MDLKKQEPSTMSMWRENKKKLSKRNRGLSEASESGHCKIMLNKRSRSSLVPAGLSRASIDRSYIYLTSAVSDPSQLARISMGRDSYAGAVHAGATTKI
jgi:hypothetical protein